jgi:predicted RNA-binding protein with PUA-like domain
MRRAVAMAYWLMKSEPSVYSFDMLRRDKVTGWSNVRNFKARNFMKDMKVGDEAFFYHSNADPPCIVGTMRVVKEAYPDPTQYEPGEYFEPKATPDKPYWYQVDVAYDKPFAQPVARDQLKERKELAGMALFRYGRLSVTPVAPAEWKVICAMGGL